MPGNLGHWDTLGRLWSISSYSSRPSGMDRQICKLSVGGSTEEEGTKLGWACGAYDRAERLL